MSNPRGGQSKIGFIVPGRTLIKLSPNRPDNHLLDNEWWDSEKEIKVCYGNIYEDSLCWTSEKKGYSKPPGVWCHANHFVIVPPQNKVLKYLGASQGYSGMLVGHFK